ncbi:MAG: hypothetical protein WA906_10805 [Pacificimonas sp.]
MTNLTVDAGLRKEPWLTRVRTKMSNVHMKICPGSFRGSADYWETRYERGGTSGAGSYGRLAIYKAEFLNAFVAKNQIETIIEFGSGDGAQLALSDYPDYLGIDISQTAIDLCIKKFTKDPRKRFQTVATYLDAVGGPAKADMTLSLDAIYHLVEEEIFDTYMTQLFDAASDYVIIYASNEERPQKVPHVRHRRFTDWVEDQRPGWTLLDHVANPYGERRSNQRNTSFADFYVFSRSSAD